MNALPDMPNPGDMIGERKQLERLSIELRIAETTAIAHNSWFAPTLDDCRVDVERILSGGRGPDGHAEADGIIVRSEVALRTWRRIAAVMGLRSAQRRCDCGGRLADVAKAGRIVPFNGLRVEVPADFVIATCSDCGAELLDERTAQSLDAVLLALSS